MINTYIIVSNFYFIIFHFSFFFFSLLIRCSSGLAEHGVKPDDIDFVVSTHSHTDHIGCNYLFLNAEHIVGHSVQRGTMFYSKQIKDGKDQCP